MPTKIVIFSDSPAAPSGLARITRDLATRIAKMDDFEVATLGYGHCGSSQLPFMQYHWSQRDDFLPLELPFIYQDFCGGEGELILLTIGDVQRFLPLADPSFAQDRRFGEWMKAARSEKKVKLWGYFPIDAHGRDGKLGPQLGHTLSHYDRILVPSEWAAEIVKNTLPHAKVDVLPHGIDTDVFKPYPHKESQELIGELVSPALQWPKEATEVSDDALWIGIVGTNQTRKSWPTGIEAVAEVAKKRDVFLWCHSDRLKAEWSLLELLSDFNLLRCSMVTVGNLSDSTMAVAYSACDVTLGIGRSEGYGYPLFESLACDTACIHTEYSGAAEYLHDALKIPAGTLRIEGPLNLLRPVFDPREWSERILAWDRFDTAPFCRGDFKLPAELDWKNLWPRFENWLREKA